jgi:cytochrome P450
VVSNRPAFPKPIEVYEPLSLFGTNIVTTEHDEWRKHRKVASPAFNERNNSLVFHETTRIVMDLFQIWQENGKGDAIVVPNMTDVTFELALQVIASAAFGYSIPWKDEDKVPIGHRMVRLPSLGSFGLCLFQLCIITLIYSCIYYPDI